MVLYEKILYEPLGVQDLLSQGKIPRIKKAVRLTVGRVVVRLQGVLV